MLVDLKGRKALITGGSQGLGKSIALRMAMSGADLILWARTPETLEAAAREIKAQAPDSEILAIPCDVASHEARLAAWEHTMKQCQGIDIIVNNAGTSQRSPIQDIKPSSLNSDMDLKVGAALHIAQLALPHMRHQNWGRIINVVSVAGKAPSAGGAPTALSRAAGLTLTKIMAAEFAPHGILVNALCVGLILSEQWQRFHQHERPELSFEEFLSSRAKAIPLGRLGNPDEFANVACFLASDLSSYITGTAINVDGGLCPVL